MIGNKYIEKIVRRELFKGKFTYKMYYISENNSINRLYFSDSKKTEIFRTLNGNSFGIVLNRFDKNEK